MKEIVEGIILNEVNFGETSKILNILTKEHGYISVISKGSKTMKSKLRGISMKFVYANFTINYKEKGLSTLIEGSPINSFKNILSNFNKLKISNRLINLMKNILKENNDINLFYLLKDSLVKINDNFNEELIEIIFETKLLSFLGVRPNFLECINCGSSNIITFDLSIPGALCENCYQEGYLFSKNTLKLLNLFLDIDISKIDKLNINSSKTLEELHFFLKEYYDSYTGIYYN